MSNEQEDEQPKWKDCAAVYPPADEIATALQDPGKKTTKKKKSGDVQIHKYPRVEKLANKLYNNILKEFNNPDGLTKNVSRGRAPIYKEIILTRRHVDVPDTHAFFHQYGDDGKVYLITNNPTHCGLDLVIESFQEATRLELTKKNTARTNNDGLRLACILLDPEFRGSVGGIMSKKKNRTKADITGDPALHFFEDILTKCFLNQDYLVAVPKEEYYNEFPEDEKGNWEPNCPTIFEHQREATWLKATWDDYVRPKYKRALDKWNKDTGGGDGSPTSFIDFCGGDRWLVWVFCLDMDANFLLAHSAAGRMPRHLQVEAGFSEDVSSLGDETSSNKCQAQLEDELSEARKQRKKLGETLDELTDFLKTKGSSSVDDEEDKNIEKVARYSAMLTDEKVLHSMSPESKEAYCATLKRKRKSVIEKMASDSR